MMCEECMGEGFIVTCCDDICNGDVWQPCELCGTYFDTVGVDVDLCMKCRRIETASKNIVANYAPQLRRGEVWLIMKIIYRAAEQLAAPDAAPVAASDNTSDSSGLRR